MSKCSVSNISNLKKCKADKCNRNSLIRNLCGKHYQRLIKNGDANITLITEKNMPSREKIELMSEKITESGCWIWTRDLVSGGYGRGRFSGKSLRAHRVSYESFVGKIPKGYYVLHRCDIPCCVNPNHLFIGTANDNSKDMVSKKRQKSILNISQVVDIKMRLNNNPYYGQVRDIANEYGVHYDTIYAIKIGKSWVHVNDPRNQRTLPGMRP